jgi:uroporphyrinogen-III synthase
MADALTRSGATVTDCILYENQPLRHSACPAFDAVFFASASAVASFVEQGFAANLGDRVVVAIGAPTAEALARGGLRTEVVGEPATVAGAMERLGDYYVRKEIGP